MKNTYFMHRIKHDASKEGSAAWDKGIEVHETREAAEGSYHAYLGAYAYGRVSQGDIDFVSCEVTDMTSGENICPRIDWIRPEVENEEASEEASEE